MKLYRARQIIIHYIRSLLLIMFMFSFPITALAAPFTYTYTGQDFQSNFIIGTVFNTSDKVTATFILDTSGGPGHIAVWEPPLTYDFTISVNGYTYNSFTAPLINPNNDALFHVDWNSAGVITLWQLVLNAWLDPNTFLEISTTSGEDWAEIFHCPVPYVSSNMTIIDEGVYVGSSGTWTAPVPEPSTMLLLGSGLLGLLGYGRKKFKK